MIVELTKTHFSHGWHGLRGNPRFRGYMSPRVRGRVLVKLGKPIEPTPNWNCRTDVIWPVLETNGKAMTRAYYVCRHQIVAGD